VFSQLLSNSVLRLEAQGILDIVWRTVDLDVSDALIPSGMSSKLIDKAKDELGKVRLILGVYEFEGGLMQS
jgi:hypothetical protein